MVHRESGIRSRCRKKCDAVIERALYTIFMQSSSLLPIESCGHGGHCTAQARTDSEEFQVAKTECETAQVTDRTNWCHCPIASMPAARSIRCEGRNLASVVLSRLQNQLEALRRTIQDSSGRRTERPHRRTKKSLHCLAEGPKQLRTNARSGSDSDQRRSRIARRHRCS